MPVFRSPLLLLMVLFNSRDAIVGTGTAVRKERLQTNENIRFSGAPLSKVTSPPLPTTPPHPTPASAALPCIGLHCRPSRASRYVGRSIGRPIIWLVDRLVGRWVVFFHSSVGHSMGWSIVLLIGRVLDRSVTWSVVCSVDRSIVWSVCRLADRSVGRSIACCPPIRRRRRSRTRACASSAPTWARRPSSRRCRSSSSSTDSGRTSKFSSPTEKTKNE